MGESKIRDSIRSMDRKGCIQIEDRSRKGHFLRILLPREIASLSLEARNNQAPPLDIETLDFFTGRKYLASLLARENNRCFYCLREVTAESASLDHVIAQADASDNSYRNVVVACHQCNSLKQATAGDEFLRILYRKGLLSVIEFEDRNAALESLRSGRLVPIIQ